MLEQLLFAGTDGAVLHRLLHHLESGGDLVGVGGCAIAAEHELADVCRDRVLPAELLGEVLLDEVAVECLGGELVELVEFGHRFCPTVVDRCSKRSRRRRQRPARRPLLRGRRLRREGSPCRSAGHVGSVGNAGRCVTSGRAKVNLRSVGQPGELDDEGEPAPFHAGDDRSRGDRTRSGHGHPRHDAFCGLTPPCS